MSDEELRALLAAQALQIRQDVAAAVAPKVPTITVEELWALFALASATRLASWRSYEQRWRDHVRPAFGARLAAEVTVEDVDRYRSVRLAAAAKMATVNREIALLRRLLSAGVRRGRLPRSQLHGPGMTGELIHPEHNVRTTIVEEDPRAGSVTLADLLEAAGPDLRAFVLLVHHGGFRRGEAAALRWDRIDRGAGVAWLPSAETKGDHGGRLVPISSEALAAISTLPRHATSSYVFPSPRRCMAGAPLHPDVWTHRFGRLVRRLGLDGPDGGPPWLHDLRRSFVTLSVRRGEDRKVIKLITGHVTDAVFDRYDALDPRDVLRFRSRAELARAELAAARGPRRPPRRSDQAFSDGSQGAAAKSS